ncbi:MAG: TIGR04222 domain-containing membrane protein, partial [Planctomycetaceae bacterium]
LNLVLTSSDQETVVIGSFAPFAVLTFFGAVKVAIGISRDKPVGILVFACIAAISAAVYLWRKRPLRTGRGDRTLALLQTQNAALKTTAASNAQDFTQNDLILATGLFGIMAVTHPALDTYRSQWRQNFGPQTSGSDGGTGWSWGSSSCSGSSCGGGSGCGGGGCGGCSSS